MVTVIALKPHSPDGNTRYKTGDRYRISDSAAKVLCAMHYVRIEDTTETPRSSPPTKTETKERKKYERRDMRAED